MTGAFMLLRRRTFFGTVAGITVAWANDAFPQVPAPLLAALRRGGHVIFFRHGETGPATSDRATAVMGDCSTQRNLNEIGRRQVTDLGAAFKLLRIPVGVVLSSEFCRCWQHAEGMFGPGNFQITAKLSAPESYPSVTDADRQLSNEHLAALLAATPPPGTNAVLISHGISLLLLTGYHPDIQGEAVVFRPNGEGGFDRVASLLPDDWRKLNTGAVD